MNDFSENNSELDKYGVWVKKTSKESHIEENNIPEEPIVDASFIEQSAATDLEIEQDLANFDIDSISNTLSTDETISNGLDINDFPITEDIENPTIDNTILEDTTTENIPIEDTLTEEIQEPQIEENIISEETSISDDELSLDDFSIDSIDDNNGPMTFEAEPEVTSEQTIESVPTAENSSTADEVSFDNGEIDLDAFMGDDNSTSVKEETPDGEVDLSSFMDDSDSSTPTQDGDVDLSAFLGDNNNGDIDLEAFMGSEGFASEREEQQEIEDTDPLDIDLDFEDNSTIELQDTEVSGEISNIEKNSSPEIAAEKTDIEDFDSFFNDVVDEKQKTETTSQSDIAIEGNTQDIDLSDFGFDDNSDNQNPVIKEEEKETKKQGPVDYEMNIDDDDSEENNTEKENQNLDTFNEDESGDIELDISQDSETSVQKEQETDLSSPDDSFDIDSILNNMEDENGETVSFSNTNNVDFTTENTSTESEEVENNEPMFQENQKIDFNETKEPTLVEDSVIEDSVIEEPIIEETAIEETFIDTPTELDLEDSETEINIPVFDEKTTEENLEDNSSVQLEDFMGAEGFTDGGPGVQGYDTIEQENSNNTDDEQKEKNIEFSNEIDYNEESVLDNENDSSVQLEDFMGAEGFTDGGPGVQGYDTIESNSTEDTNTEPEVIDSNLTTDFEKTIDSDTIDDEKNEAKEEIEDMSNAAEESNIEDEIDYSNISAFADKKTEYDMTGVTVTLDDFENIKDSSTEAIEENTETSVIDEPIIEDTSVLDSEIVQDEVETYSVFIKTESSSGHVENTGVVSEEKDLSTEETDAEAPVSAEETMNSFDSSSILSQISNDLDSLRTEIRDLKSEFEEMKKNGIPSETTINEENVIDEVNLPESSEGTGFFNDTDEDDTIALSGDELSNILSTAEFTSETEENLDESLKIDFNNEELEESVFDDSEIQDNILEESNIEDSVPTIDDVLVESSSTDLMDNTISTAEEENNELPSDDDIPSPTLESLYEQDYEENNLTEDNIEYLREDSEDENLEVGISEQPVETVFNNWEATTEEELTEPVIEEPIIEETSINEEEINNSVELNTNDIPANMKEEIKSVLSYMDQLLENLPEDKIAEFAQSEQFETYKKLFTELGLS